MNTIYQFFLLKYYLNLLGDIIDRTLTLLNQNGKKAFMESIIKTSESFKKK